jgi:protein-S-isoprenylcysteine O-methyltransferase Ste14
VRESQPARREEYPDGERDVRTWVFKHRGLLLVPVALILVVWGRPSLRSAIIGLSVALVGEVIRMWAVGYAGTTTRADSVTAPRLVTAGPYAYVRNPLYAGNALIALGFWLAFSGNVPAATSLLMFVAVAAIVTAVYATIIPLEEEYLARTFGGAYESYRRRVPRIVPLGTPLAPEERQGSWDARVLWRAEIITIAYFIVMAAVIGVRLWLWPAK